MDPDLSRYYFSGNVQRGTSERGREDRPRALILQIDYSLDLSVADTKKLVYHSVSQFIGYHASEALFNKHGTCGT